jgi:hypothetical protein
MTDQTVRDELQVMADSYHLMDQLLAENDEFKTRVDAAERSAEMLDRENSDLRREIKRAKAERDHYSRAFTALSAQLDGLAASMVTAVTMSRAQAYGGRRPLTEVEKLTPSTLQPPLPTFLRQPRENDTKPISLDELTPSPVDKPHTVVDLGEIAERMQAMAGNDR